MRAATSVGLADRLERDEEHAIRVPIGGVRGDLQGQSRLTGAAGPGQGHEPVRLEERGGLGELALPPDERGELGRQVVRPRVERAERRELHPQAVGDDLAQRLRLAEVLQPMPAEAEQRDAGPEVGGDERANRVGDDDLAAVGRRGDPRRAMDVQPHQARRRFGRLAGVEAHAHVDLDARRPRLRGERTLCLDGRHDGLDRAVEHDEERVALGRLLASAVGDEGRAEQLRLALQDRACTPRCRATRAAAWSPRCPRTGR